ncbi:uncharacterized protein LOC144085691 isoform X2 [Stigmatopora argus]
MSPESTAADSVRSCSGERRSHVRRRKVADPLARDANVSRGWLLFLRSPNVVDASARVNPRLNPTFCLLPWRDGASSFSVKAAQMSRVHCETAEDSRVHYETDYVEAIGQRMRVPETLKVAGVGVPAPQRPPGAHSALMQVPERIVVAGDGEARFSCPRDLDLIQCVAGAELLDMKAPPHVLTLAQLPLDSLETRRASEGESEPARTAPPRSGEAAPTRHGRQVIRGDVSPHVPRPVPPRGRRRQPDRHHGGRLPALRPVGHAPGLPTAPPALGRRPATVAGGPGAGLGRQPRRVWLGGRLLHTTTDREAQPPSADAGGRKQGTLQARSAAVFCYRGLLAGQHLGLVPPLRRKQRRSFTFTGHTNILLRSWLPSRDLGAHSAPSTATEVPIYVTAESQSLTDVIMKWGMIIG